MYEAAANIDLSKPPTAPEYVRFRDGIGPRFVITIDTEEEFDWHAPIERDGHGLASVPELARFQAFCEEFGVVPIYLIDRPIAEAPATNIAIGEAVRAGRAEVGVHLHPWVEAPFTEEISEINSFPGNLPAELEQQKFRGLHATIKQTFSISPAIYRAGRYGIGPNSAVMLGETGISIDTSVRSLFDYREAGGPDFNRHPLKPYWVDRPGGLMELPLTAVYGGPLRPLGPHMHPALRRIPRLTGALARFGILQRIPLTPEGVTVAEAIRGIDIALGDDLPLLVFSFHSPSLAAGHTPYVRSPADVEGFYDWWRAVFAHLARRGVASSSVRDILASVALA